MQINHKDTKQNERKKGLILVILKTAYYRQAIVQLQNIGIVMQPRH